MKTKLTILFSLLMVASMIITACGGGAAPTEAPVETQAPAATDVPAATAAPAAFSEAPDLAEQVKAGTLPPV